jgi:CheY-like chemotaxis protein
MLLEKINSIFDTLGIPKIEIFKVPKFLKEYEPLKGKCIVMVDDNKKELKSFAPYLVVATEGNASFILNEENQELDELVEQIRKYDQSIVLMDYNLSRGLKGTSVIEELRKKDFSGKIIGFSAMINEDLIAKFLDAGALNVIEKRICPFSEIIVKLANLITESESSDNKK